MLEPQNWKWRIYMYTCCMATHNFHYNLSYAEANHNIFFVSGSSWGFFGALNLKLPFATIRCLCACCRPGASVHAADPGGQYAASVHAADPGGIKWSLSARCRIRASAQRHISSVLHWECRHGKCILESSTFCSRNGHLVFAKT